MKRVGLVETWFCFVGEPMQGEARNGNHAQTMTRANVKLRVKLPSNAGYLTPYRRSHVPKYSSWMQQDEELRQQTGSEEQTLEEEYLNQIQWRDDASKCTFIITDNTLTPIGDVNLFFSAVEDEENKLQAEINVMIAEKQFRGKGYGKLAVWGMAWFAQRHFPLVSQYLVKISFDNTASIALFTQKLGFTELSRSEAFQECTLVCPAEKLYEQFAAVGFTEEPCLDDDTEFLRLRGNAAFENRDFVQAIRFYDEAIKLDHRDEVLRSNRSAARLRSGELFGALSDAMIASILQPNYIKAYHRLGNAWAAMGYEDRAKETYRIATREFPQQQQMFDDLARKTVHGYKSLVESTPVTEEEFKLAPRGVELEVEIETKSDSPRAVRFGCILYIWKFLSGAERMGVYQECIRAGYAPEDAVTTPEQLEQAPVPEWPEAAKSQDLPAKFAQYVQSLEAGVPRVAGLVLLFEGCSFEEREEVGKMLLAVLLQQQ